MNYFDPYKLGLGRIYFCAKRTTGNTKPGPKLSAINSQELELIHNNTAQ